MQSSSACVGSLSIMLEFRNWLGHFDFPNPVFAVQSNLYFQPGVGVLYITVSKYHGINPI